MTRPFPSAAPAPGGVHPLPPTEAVQREVVRLGQHRDLLRARQPPVHGVRAVARRNNDRKIRPQCPQVGDKIVAFAVGQSEIHDGNSETTDIGMRAVHRGLRGRSFDHLEAQLLQGIRGDGGNQCLILDQQGVSCSGRHAGTWTDGHSIGVRYDAVNGCTFVKNTPMRPAAHYLPRSR
jgi:hypothetical protein